MSSEALVSLSPAEMLVFHLEKDTSPKAILRVTNTSESRVVFKVKTTQPSWYYVRPNQQIVEIGATEEVTIVLVDAECSRFLERASTDKAERLDKHRFLVQAKEIDDDDYYKVVALPVNLRGDEYNRIWNTGSKDEKKNLKLKVDFVYPDSVEVPSEPKRSVSENVEILRNKITKESNLDQRDDTSSQMPPENMFAELKNLRTKYDSVVEYTVRLTAERDMMVQRLEGIEKELTIARKKANQSDSANIGMKSDKLKKKSFTKEFSLAVVLVIALLSFLFGRYNKF